MSTILRHIILCTSVLFWLQNLFSQSSVEDNIEEYFTRIENLVNDNINDPNVFLDRDNLLNKLSDANGIEKADLLLRLYTYFIFHSADVARLHNKNALVLSNRINYTEGSFRAMYNEAYTRFIEGQFEGSLEVIKKSLSDNELSTFPDVEADFQTLKSYVHTERGEYDDALQLCLKLLSNGGEEESDYVLMRGYSAISHFYLRLGDYRKALDYCLKGLDIIIELKKVHYILPKIDEIARMTHHLGESEKALDIYTFYLDLEQKISTSGDYINSVVYMNIADIYIQEKKYSKAKSFLTKALKLIRSKGYGFREPRAHLLLAKLNLATNDTLSAIESYQKGYRAAEEINAYDVIKVASNELAKIYRLQKDTENASMFSSIHKSLSDSLFSTETKQRVKILEAQIKISEISGQKKLLEIENKSKDERYRFILIILLMCLVTLSITVYSYLKVKGKNKLLFKRTKEIASHKINSSNAEKIENPKSVGLKTSENTISNPQPIDVDVKSIILSKLNKLEKEKFFLDPKCSLNQVANKLQTNQKYLSQVINQEKKSNFNNYLNDLRINFLLERLLKDAEFRNNKLSYISSSVGYNTLNTFNSAFKKRLGILPSYFIKELNEEAEGKQ